MSESVGAKAPMGNPPMVSWEEEQEKFPLYASDTQLFKF